ncbi:Fic family protein [Sporichthya sp.]|uniref:Fic family protein n=1 Tax=Sporichthya sp. TaxID=65475 RepID=UPI001806EDE2|nr:Fic family protein [Sporichthya sp.]MBA3742594.1 Fic family protein [Sporichthya sp.]
MARGRPSRQAIYARLEEAINDLDTRMGGLPNPAEAEEIWDELWHQEAHHSTALEGNTLVLNEVRKLLDEGRAVGSKELKEYMEVVGYGAAAKWVYGQALEPGGWTTGDLLSIQEVRTVHYEAMTPVWNVAPHSNATPAETPGNWRKHDIHPFPEGMTPPPFPEVDHRMTDWVRGVNELREESEVALPERLAKVHNDFERIHPYLDGNGRAGRLLLNLILVRLGYPPAIVFKNERTKYLDAMRKADKGDYGPLGELIARAVTNNLYRFVVPAVAGPARLVPLASLIEAKTGVTATALRAAAERGRLRAQKSDNGTWLSSKKWVEDYQRDKHKRINNAAKPGA